MEIVKYPREILREKAKPIEKISDSIFELADSMISIMLENKGIGLAANQVGKLYRLFVINLNPFEDKPELLAVINPKIIDREGMDVDEEGCLSFPGLYLNIPRAKKIRLHMQNLYNEKMVLDTEGIVARAIQHEIDHLDGVLFIDYVSEEEKPKLKRYLDDLKTMNNSNLKANNL
ncbi:MAG: peptide deformylase [candidate division WOR-3 bacterium]